MSKLSANLQKGLVGHWTMDDRDTDNGMLRDRSAYGNDGSIEGPITDQGGIVGESFEFNGGETDGDVVKTELSPADIDDNTVTFSSWLYTYDNEKRQKIITGYTDATDDRWDIEIRDALLQFNAWNYDSIVGDTQFTQESWLHVSAVWEPGEEVILYIDGDEDGRGSQELNSLDDGGDISIGRRTYQQRDEPSWDGRIDDVRIYNRALSESEIEALYNMRSQRTSNI